jgi:hypothetical protein
MGFLYSQYKDGAMARSGKRGRAEASGTAPSGRPCGRIIPLEIAEM